MEREYGWTEIRISFCLASVNVQPKNPQPLGPNQAFLLTRVPSSRVSSNVFSGRMERPF